MAAWTRAQWLAAVDGMLAPPVTLPRLDDAEGHARFMQLVRPEPWSARGAEVFAEHGDELVAFFPAFKRVLLAYGTQGSADEVLVLSMFGVDAFAAIIAAAEAHLARMPADEPTRATRLGGLDKMRLGAAIELCGVLYTATDGSPARRDAALAALAEPARYASHSREGLQLIQATLDEQLLPEIRAELRTAYQAIRATVVRAQADRPAPTTGRRTTYQGIGKFAQRPATRLVSRTGGFSVEIGPAAIAKRVDISRADGATLTSHAIELQDGAVRFDVVCFDGASEASLVALTRPSPTQRANPSALPGSWSVDRTDANEHRSRIVSLGDRGCIAEVAGPAAGFPGDRADAFLGSLAPVPAARP